MRNTLESSFLKANASGAMETRVETDPPRAAYTLVEMIVTVAVLGLLVTFLAPALAGSRVGGRAAVCVQNTRRLNNAWTMYAQENHDQLVQNFQGGLAQGGNFPAALGPAWASGWLDWSTSA